MLQFKYTVYVCFRNGMFADYIPWNQTMWFFSAIIVNVTFIPYELTKRVFCCLSVYLHHSHLLVLCQWEYKPVSRYWFTVDIISLSSHDLTGA